MNIKHLRSEKCPDCGADTRSVVRSHQHTNGEWNERREYTCGRTDEYNPSFSRVQHVAMCGKTPEHIERQARIEKAKKDIEDFVRAIPLVSFKDKRGILTDLSWRYEEGELPK